MYFKKRKITWNIDKSIKFPPSSSISKQNFKMRNDFPQRAIMSYQYRIAIDRFRKIVLYRKNIFLHMGQVSEPMTFCIIIRKPSITFVALTRNHLIITLFRETRNQAVYTPDLRWANDFSKRLCLGRQFILHGVNSQSSLSNADLSSCSPWERVTVRGSALFPLILSGVGLKNNEWMFQGCTFRNGVPGLPGNGKRIIKL